MLEITSNTPTKTGERFTSLQVRVTSDKQKIQSSDLPKCRRTL